MTAHPHRLTPATEHIDSALLTTLLATTHDHLLITDGEGRILRASPSCGAVYGLTVEALCETTVAELERRGVLAPSVTLRVLATRCPQRVMQTTPTGRQVLAEAHPVFIGDELVRIISRSRDTTDLRHLQEEYVQLTRHLSAQLRHSGDTADEADPGFEAHSRAMQEVRGLLRRVADTDATVLLLGESGVGKTLLARQLHRWSSRRDGPFIDINCGAIPEGLFEAEMFGSMPGAFSGAPPRGRPGLLEQAEGGTLLLDEIGELPLGDTQPRRLDFRLIVATHQDLASRVEAGSFRLDLFYRLNVVPVSIPPLRERREEIPALVERHMSRLGERYGETRVVDESLWGYLMGHDWPGNVRELENFLERRWLAGSDTPGRIGETGTAAPADDTVSGAEPMPPTLAEALARTERACLEQAARDAGSTYEVARRLGISQPGAVRKLRKHGIKLTGHHA
ncbi:transcriptional regulator with PAS, ATPase and Fis domain [Kushneria sinocarnis]|uniref:HTH-type transcriptional regulatory protein TyrR n=2 Tax=Kushneria sinocarnis TaxID=595502 RepID=A0A420WW01_9GAMM|nr:transcriptional regulator with PAS, ATPase and Fis domain [Kushneria sinocarnis]